ncbi:MAG: alpha/beta hydrolase, partial [Rhodocyclaceae bacterium]|nr:alpha/beta hydrolase [Rhodocyclaceae bacterium]
EVVEKLVIINSPHAVPFAKALAGDPAQQAASQYMRMLRDPGAEALLSADGYAGLKALFDRFGEGWKGLPEGDRARYLEAWSRPGALTGALNYYRASPLYPPGPEGGDGCGAAGLAIDPAPFVVRVPTLVIWGEEDAALLPCLLDGLDQVVAELRLERVPDAGHWIVHEQPDTVNRLVRDFLAAPGAHAGSGASA